MSSINRREHIVAMADMLFYQQGFDHTSFADIADTVGISRGNFYYHFKTKDEILEAVIARRLGKTAQMLDQWESVGQTPEARIRSFIRILMVNGSTIKNYGCPVGTLCAELAKLHHPARAEANQLFDLFRHWLRHQFSLLGYKTDADTLALHLLARSQGIASLANAYQDDKFIQREVRLLEAWLDSCVDNTASVRVPKKTIRIK